MSRIEISKKLVLLNSASSAVSVILNLSILVWLQQYLLRRVSAEEYSLVPIVMSLMAFAPLIATVLTGGIGLYMTVAYAKGDDREVTSVCSTMFPILSIAGLVFLCMGWFGAWYVDRLVTLSPARVGEARVMLALLAFSTAVQLPSAAFGGGFIVRQKFLLLDLIEVGSQFLRIAILFALLFGVSTRVLWITTATVISELANLAVTIPISIYLVPAQRIRWSSFRWSLARQITAYGTWNLLSQVAQTLKQAMDPLILNRWATAHHVATFYAAGMAPRQLPALAAPLGRPFIPIFAALHSTGDFARLRNTYMRTARYNAWIQIAVAVPAIVFSRELMLLYLGDKYPQAGPVMSLLLIVPVFSAFNAMGPASAMAAGEMRGLSIRQIIVHSINLLLTLLFVAFLRQGALGSAAGTVIAVVGVETFVVWPMCWRVTHTPRVQWFRQVILPTVLPAIPALLLCLGLKWTLGVDTWISIFAASGLSALLYVSLVAAFGLQQQDRIDLDRVADLLPEPAKNIARRLLGGSPS